jgi:hypothetical protein
MNAKNETKRTGLQDAVIGVVLLAVGFHLFAVSTPLAIAAVCVGLVSAYNGVTTK